MDLGFFSFLCLNDVEKVREAYRAAGGDGHRRGCRERQLGVYCVGANEDVALDVGNRAVVRDAWRRAARHGRFCP